MITTKRKGGRMHYRSPESGFYDASRTIPMMNTEQYLSMRREAVANSNVTPQPDIEPDLLVFDQNKIQIG
ncbi:hypothetical protein CS542_07970 [Pedobacter sp. IW39]|nr:hypothetical protein CS542_07970 [Pedobacter sp. IW39]